MNNRGQSLITFVLILPLITLLLAFFIDSSLSMMEKNKMEGVITSNIKEALDDNIRDSQKIASAIKENIDVNLGITIEEDILNIHATSNKKTVFGKILNFSWYKLEFNYQGDYVTKEIKKN